MKKALQSVGVVALLAWTVAGSYAWYRVKGHFEVNVQPTAEGGDDELALLDDRLETLSSDLDALVTSIQENFGLLASAVQDGDGSEGIERARLEERIRQLESALPLALEAREVSGALASVLTRLESIEGSPGPGVAAADRPPARTMAEHEAEEPAQPVAENARAAEAAERPMPEVGVSEARSGRSFLAFKLPSRDFRFEGTQTFELLEDLSRVGFDAKSTLHDFTGISNRVRGHFRLDLSRPDQGIEGQVEVDVSTLDTGLEGRDEAMLEHLQANEFAGMTFVATRLTPHEIHAETQSLSGSLAGQMTIRGVTQEVSMDVTAHVDESRRLVIQGEMPLLLTDYAVPVPNKLGVISMDDEVRVWVHLRARSKPEASR